MVRTHIIAQLRRRGTEPGDDEDQTERVTRGGGMPQQPCLLGKVKAATAVPVFTASAVTKAGVWSKTNAACARDALTSTVWTDSTRAALCAWPA